MNIKTVFGEETSGVNYRVPFYYGIKRCLIAEQSNIRIRSTFEFGIRIWSICRCKKNQILTPNPQRQRFRSLKDRDPMKQCCGSGMFNPDPGSDFFPSRILDPGFEFLHPYSISTSKNLSILTPNFFLLLKKWSGLLIPDPDPDFYPFRIPDPGVKKTPDPGFATLQWRKSFVDEEIFLGRMLTNKTICELLEQLRVAKVDAELHIVLHRQVLAQVTQILQPSTQSITVLNSINHSPQLNQSQSSTQSITSFDSINQSSQLNQSQCFTRNEED